MEVPSRNLKIYQGRTLFFVVRWGAPPYIYKPITAITKAAPAKVTAVGHGLKSGWPVAIVSVEGMTEINASKSPPSLEKDFHKCTVVDVDNVEFNDINSLEFTAWTAGGALQFYTPKDLTAAIVRLTFRDKDGGTALLTLASDGVSPAITIDNVNHTITVNVSAATLTGITWKTAVYDMEVQTNDGIVTPIQRGTAKVIVERATN